MQIKIPSQMPTKALTTNTKNESWCRVGEMGTFVHCRWENHSATLEINLEGSPKHHTLCPTTGITALVPSALVTGQEMEVTDE